MVTGHKKLLPSLVIFVITSDSEFLKNWTRCCSNKGGFCGRCIG
jgi:hypothetical protein